MSQTVTTIVFQALSDILSSRSEIGAKPRHNFFQFSNKFGAYVAYAKNELEPLVSTILFKN